MWPFKWFYIKSYHAPHVINAEYLKFKLYDEGDRKQGIYNWSLNLWIGNFLLVSNVDHYTYLWLYWLMYVYQVDRNLQSQLIRIQLNLNLTKHCMSCTWYNRFFISFGYMHACAHKIDDIEFLMQSTCVHTGHVHDNLHKHVCMSVAYTPNLVHMHVDV